MVGGGRKPQIEALVKLKKRYPLNSPNELPPTKNTRATAICLHELSILLACYKNNGYIEAPCVRELASFQKCYNAHTLQHQEGFKSKSKLSSNEVNTLLKRFPSK